MRRTKARGCYLPVIEWANENDPFTGNTDCLTYLFQQNGTKIADIFQQIYFKFKELDSAGEEQLDYLNCGLSINEIRNDYLALYGERLVSQLFYFDSSNENSKTGNQTSLTRLAAKLKAVLDQNYFKYKRLAETLGFVYDPISNYDMIESGSDTKTFAGKETLDHSVDATKINSREAFGPLRNINIDEGFTIVFDESKKIATEQQAVSDVQAGKKVSTNSSSESGIGIGIEDGGTPTTNHYTTTMDDAATGRLKNYDTTTGDTAQNSAMKSITDMPLTGRVSAGNPNAPSYTDTKSFDSRTDSNTHNLTRSGNIGVTTSQQMIESERQLVRFSLLKEFFDDINRELLLSVWD